jgi:hypothetical protein
LEERVGEEERARDGDDDDDDDDLPADEARRKELIGSRSTKRPGA